MVKKAALCKIYLKPGHIASKCHSPPMCKKGHKHHPTLLHIDSDPKTEQKKKVSRDVTCMAPSKRGEEVLLNDLFSRGHGSRWQHNVSQSFVK